MKEKKWRCDHSDCPSLEQVHSTSDNMDEALCPMCSRPMHLICQVESAGETIKNNNH